MSDDPNNPEDDVTDSNHPDDRGDADVPKKGGDDDGKVPLHRRDAITYREAVMLGIVGSERWLKTQVSIGTVSRSVMHQGRMVRFARRDLIEELKGL